MRASHGAALLLGIAGFAGIGTVSLSRVGAQLEVLSACEALQRGDPATALARTEQRVGPSETGRAAATCRCYALLATERGAECVALLDAMLSDRDNRDWSLEPQLFIHLIQTRRDAGHGRAAAALAQRAARSHPRDANLFYLELATRANVEDEARVLRELGDRLDGDPTLPSRMRASLANRHLLRGDPEGALAALGDRAPDPGDTTAPIWHETRGMALARAGDLAGLQRSYVAWRRAGGDPAELRARYSLTLSIAGLSDPKRPTPRLLEAALAGGPAVGDAALREALVTRLILTRASLGETDAALALYDAYRVEFALRGLSREELQRSGAQRLLDATPPDARRGTLRFAVTSPSPGDVILLSPDAGAAPDGDYEVHPVPDDGIVTAYRSAGIAPQRWVLRDARGRVRASGTTSPAPGHEVTVPVEAGDPIDPLAWVHARRPADGRRRVALLLLDGADWRIAQYLRTRGELPVFDSLLRRGHRAVLDSDPPLTAAALESLVWPRRHGAASFAGIVHQLGVELAGLASVGDNPAEPLAWLLPEHADLFAVVGAGDLSAANLLFSHGGIRAGRHGEVTGPRGARRRVPFSRAARDLTAAERERWPALAAKMGGRDAVHLSTIAAEFDAAEEILRAGDIDLLALRIEPLDILTHAHFADAVRDGRDDGRGLLFSVYRYIDARLGAVDALLDEDDVLVVMSDHGIRTAMEHARDAIFVIVGGGVPPGRAPGRPALRGVASVLAGLLGIDADWPDSGVAPWIATTDPRPALASN